MVMKYNIGNLVGSFKGKVYLICCTLAALAFSAFSDIDGDWYGMLNIGSQKLRLVFHVDSSDSKILMDSPDQGAYNITTETLLLSQDSLSLQVPAIGMSYAGCLKSDTIYGVFKQGFLKLPVTLLRGTGEILRPQTPNPPFPYMTEEAIIENREGKSRLSGTLTLPEKCSASTPVAVLVSGSGLQDRDETIFGHKPFAVIADYLARHGIASFRYDDRGVGGSSGELENATTETFASDARAVYDWLRNTGRFSHVGIVGHSEGGLIGGILSSDESHPDFMVGIASPVVDGIETIAYQNERSLIKKGIPEKTARDFREALRIVLVWKIKAAEGDELSPELLHTFYPSYEDNQTTKLLEKELQKVATDKINPWFRFFLGYQPDYNYRNVPTLLIYGGKDCQVEAELNATLARENMGMETVMVFPGLNHLMQHAVTGDTDEYYGISETISTDVLDSIAEFIHRSVGDQCGENNQ